MSKMNPEEACAIGDISTFFGSRSGYPKIDDLLEIYGFSNVPDGNKIKKIAYFLRQTYLTKPAFEKLLNALVSSHKLRQNEIDEVNKSLAKLGYQISEGKIQPAEKTEIVYSVPKPFDAFRDIERIMGNAKTEVKIIDAYVDERLFPLYFYDANPSVSIKVLTTKMQGKFEEAAKKFRIQKSNFEVKKTDQIHDRYIITDDRVWSLGQSLKDAGTKPLCILELQDKNAKDAVFAMFLRLWSKGTTII